MDWFLYDNGLRHERAKILYLDCCSTYGHHTWQDDNLPWGAPTHKVKLHFDQVALEGQVLK